MIEVLKLQFFPIVLASLAVLILSFSGSFAESEPGADAVGRPPTEDPSCDFVNRSYQKTYRSERLSFVTYELPQEEQLKRRLDVRFIDEMVFQRLEPGGSWRSWTIKARPSIFSSSGPVFNDCSLLREEGDGSSKLIVYSSEWKREQYRALITIWISETDGRIVKTRRDFDSVAPLVKQFRTASVIEIYEYDADKIVGPRLVSF
ncbi:hypothetical protein [Ciceribacter sp. S95]|uniref:hypothetical protein n=1 Tax=Ciceribacter sp. S95 TaxID=2949648 RepID=UPI002033A1B0|nr:hypothetical protein [Ciceribacter sp. S95]